MQEAFHEPVKEAEIEGLNESDLYPDCSGLLRSFTHGQNDTLAALFSNDLPLEQNSSSYLVRPEGPGQGTE